MAVELVPIVTYPTYVYVVRRLLPFTNALGKPQKAWAQTNDVGTTPWDPDTRVWGV
jgi:hypothetical protein